MNDNNQKCQATIDQLGLHPRIVQHEPILNFETAEKVPGVRSNRHRD